RSPSTSWRGSKRPPGAGSSAPGSASMSGRPSTPRSAGRGPETSCCCASTSRPTPGTTSRPAGLCRSRPRRATRAPGASELFSRPPDQRADPLGTCRNATPVAQVAEDLRSLRKCREGDDVVGARLPQHPVQGRHLIGKHRCLGLAAVDDAGLQTVDQVLPIPATQVSLELRDRHPIGTARRGVTKSMEEEIGAVPGSAEAEKDSGAPGSQALTNFDKTSQTVFVVGVIDDD